MNVTMNFNQKDFSKIVKNSYSFPMEYYYDGIEKTKIFSAVIFTKGGKIVSGDNHTFSYIEGVTTDKTFMLDTDIAETLAEYIAKDVVDTLELTDTDLIVKCNDLEIALPLLRNGDGDVENRISNYDSIINESIWREYETKLTFTKKEIKEKLKQARQAQMTIVGTPYAKNNFVSTNTAITDTGGVIYSVNLSKEQIEKKEFKLINAKIMNTVVTKVTNKTVTIMYSKDVKKLKSGVKIHTPFVLKSDNITSVIMPLNELEQI